MNNLEILIKFLSYLGLDFEQSKIYLALTDKGGMTVLELSRVTKISRTNVYRIVERLVEMGLAEETLRSGKKIITPVGLHKLELLVKEQESKAEFLRNVLPEISTIIPMNESITQPETKVISYRGVDGVKQMVWNTLQAGGECVGYSFRRLDEILGDDFVNKWRMEFLFRKLRFRDIIGDEYLSSVSRSENKLRFDPEHFRSKYVPDEILKISHQIDIYNDVVSFYMWHDDEIFGIEIYNAKIAKLQKQLFEIVWKLGSDI